MLEITGDPVFVGKLMGHKNPLTTTRYLYPSLLKAKQLIDRRNEQAARPYVTLGPFWKLQNWDVSV